MASPSRKTYTDEDKAHVLFTLTTNDGNIKKTARETSVPEATIRRWRDEWDRKGVPEPILASATTEANGFIQEAEVVRSEALRILRAKLPTAKPGELNAIVGTLDDKITRAKGLPTQRVQHDHELPPPAEQRALMSALIIDAIADAARRQREIADVIDAEIVEPAELPPGDSHSTNPER